MFRNYLQTAFRNIRKRSSFSVLNIAGFAIGIGCAGLIFLWVQDVGVRVPAEERGNHSQFF